MIANIMILLFGQKILKFFINTRKVNLQSILFYD